MNPTPVSTLAPATTAFNPWTNLFQPNCNMFGVPCLWITGGLVGVALLMFWPRGR